ncbi:IDO-domain-containing protein, partial [Caulochytrium protostelioides]
DLHPDFAPWETLLSQLQAFLLVRQLRRHVETALPPFPISALPPFEHATRAELAAWKRAYLLLAFIAHGYVWSKNEAASRWLPHVLATPWKRVSTQLGLPPVSTYAASVLWNLHIVDPAQPWSLDNMGIMHSFTGMDEAWFYLISAGIEARGGRAPRLILEA